MELVTLLRDGEVYIHGAPNGLSEDHPIRAQQPTVCTVNAYDYWSRIKIRLDELRPDRPDWVAEMETQLADNPD